MPISNRKNATARSFKAVGRLFAFVGLTAVLRPLMMDTRLIVVLFRQPLLPRL